MEKVRSGNEKKHAHIQSRQRVADYGEVLTPPSIVNAMLDLVKLETERVDSRFLEPACGTGNFLIEILERKLRVAENRYAKSQPEYERYAILSVSSLYGIDILEDNAEVCRKRLFDCFDTAYTRLYRDQAKKECRKTVQYILKRNIIHGDALSLKTVGPNPEPIVFSEWSLINSRLLKRRDFAFHELLAQGTMRGLPLFSDLGEEAFVPEPVREYPPVPYLEVSDAYGD
ncbi:MAG TPA: N-6 DNA methylase [Anaerohalosphaeraceae bacterium]|nr:N-6 DNA methylase [Anaerohalosphaeraceae bacterium]HOL89314.1 N-6 DNA methylase [Anaerohalosphaeraceae bacterium]HPP56899.1 N-6 DNA methylase [Anaerohalosphaeraceae bacterium]